MGFATTRIPQLLLHHRPTSSSFLLHRLRRLSTLTPTPTVFNSHTPRLHSNPSPPTATSQTSVPWPEWSHFLDRVSGSAFGFRNEVHLDEFAASSRLDDHFFKDATSFLSFARQFPSLLWDLPREDIEVIVENVSPSLFKDAAAVTSRMRSFLAGGVVHVPESDKPSTVDLMKFLLSYVHTAIISFEAVYISSKVESSVRKLFSELVKSRGASLESIASLHNQNPEGNEVGPRSCGNNIEMKRGDWTCTRCSFMNFAKNKNCLECGELRPKKFVEGGEWECPRCDFFNFSRNVVCLRCDCKKPEASSVHSPANVSGLGANISSVKSNTEKPLAKSEGEQQPWLTKITQLEKSSDWNSSVTDEDFSKFMQADNNRVSSLPSNLAIDGNPDGALMPSIADSNTSVDIGQNVDELLAQKSTSSYTSNTGGISGESRTPFDTSSSVSSNEDMPEIMPMRTGENRFVVSKKKDRSLTSPMYKRRVAMEPAGSSSNHVSFVPFPPGYFAQNNSDSSTANNSDNVTVPNQHTGALASNLGQTGERNEHKPTNSYETSQNKDHVSQFSSGGTNLYGGSQVRENSSVQDTPWRGKSLEGSAVKESDPLDMSEEAKTERWFRRVAQIKDISELSQIPDEDFPSIMPLRKGVNRFVVSKRKSPLERRLTSSQYHKNPSVANPEPDYDQIKPESG